MPWFPFASLGRAEMISMELFRISSEFSRYSSDRLDEITILIMRDPVRHLKAALTVRTW